MSREQQVGWMILTGSLLVIVGFTLDPLAWEMDGRTGNVGENEIRVLPSSLFDVPRNVALFVPFGFGVGFWLASGRGTWRKKLMWAAAGGFVVTALVEACQLFLPARTSNLSDVVANTLGAVAGFGMHFLWKERVWLRERLGDRRLIPIFVGVYSLVGLISLIGHWTLMEGLKPRGWDESYPLAVGDELSGGRPWEGTVVRFILFDIAVRESEARELGTGKVPSPLLPNVVTAYEVNQTGRLRGRVGETLELRKGREVGASGEEMAAQDGAWWETVASMPEVARRVSRSGAFTLEVAVVPDRLDQHGPARILTFSQDTEHRNFTLGQEGAKLVLRWRSVLTGKNGMTPEIQFPDCFQAGESSRLVLVCDGGSVTLFDLDDEQTKRFFLGPEAGWGALLLEGRYWPLMTDGGRLWVLRLFLLIGSCVPMGFMLGLVGGHIGRRSLRASVFVLGMMTPALVQEGQISFYAGQGVRWDAMVTGIILVGVGILLAKRIVSVRGVPRIEGPEA